MDFFTIVAVAFGLSFDTFAASLVFGIKQFKIVFFQAIKIALVMAFFQGGLTIIGFFLGSFISSYLNVVDHWIAFAILFVIGVKMITGGKGERNAAEERDYTKLSDLIAIAVGTSIDAAAAGISFALIDIRIWFAGSVIGVVTFLASMTAIRIGKAAGEKISKKVAKVGGLILIAIGVKILMEHLIR